jgi:sodium transport system permease protein
MRFKIIWTIFRKEIRETLRDRRTLIMMVGIPILLYPMMLLLLTKLQESQEEAQELKTSRVAVWGEVSAAFNSKLRGNPFFSVEQWKGAPDTVRQGILSGQLQPLPPMEEKKTSKKTDTKTGKNPASILEAENPLQTAVRSLISRREIDAVLVLWKGFESAIGQGGLGKATLYFDSVNQDSAKARGRLEDAMIEYRKEILQAREKEHGLPTGFSKGVDITVRNVAPQSRRLGQMIGMLLPFLLIIISASSSFYAAIDMTAGEKERNTMQTLLCAPVNYKEIVAGKFLAVWCIGLIATLANIASMAATFTRMVAPEGMISLSPSLYLLSFFALLPVTFLVTALYLAIAVFARDFKDGQNFLTPVLFALMIPLSATMVPGIELNPWTAFVPVVNVALLIKSLFLGEAKPDLLFLALASSTVYSAMALLFAARIFEREQLLLGGRESIGSIFKLGRTQDRMPTPTMAVTCYCLVFVLVFYGSLLLQNASITTILLTTEFLFFLAPTLGVSFWAGHCFTETYRLRLPRIPEIAGCLLVGISAWAAVGGLIVRLFPPPESLSHALQKMILLGDKPQPLWTLWLVIGLTPALCEEFFFRGMVMSGLKRWGAAGAILTSALLFGIAHSSIYRLLPTFVLGILMGYAAWRTRSIVSSILIHTLNNGVAATLVYYASSYPALEGWDKQKFLPWSWTLGGAVILSAGMALLYWGGPKVNDVDVT